MCFNAQQTLVGAYYHPFIAGEDIVTFKEVTSMWEHGKRTANKFKSQHQYFLYESGYQYTVDKFPDKVKKHHLGDYSIDLGKEGLHSWQLKKINVKDTDGMWGTVLIKCVIPKGTRYYVGIRDEILSESLIIKGRIFAKDKTRILEKLKLK